MGRTTRGKKPRQLALFAKVLTRFAKRKDGKRKATPGRKPTAERKGFVPHTVRPFHDADHPVHVTMHRVARGPDFKCPSLFNAILLEIEHANRNGAQIVHYSIQSQHIHLIVESAERLTISRKMQQLFSRITFAVNRRLARAGKLFRDRHHRRELTSPRQVRNALVYVLFNDRHHGLPKTETSLDLCSSAVWFTDWSETSKPPERHVLAARRYSDVNPMVPPDTWLARTGWKRGGGPIRFDERPRVVA